MYIAFHSRKTLLDKKEIFATNHDINGIWVRTKKSIEKFGFGYGREEVDFNHMIMNLESYLHELYQTIMVNDFDKAYKNIDFSRFPTNIKLENHFYLKTYENVAVDLENFIEVFTDVGECLYSLANYYYNLVVESWQS